jgi:hypothetical protein
VNLAKFKTFDDFVRFVANSQIPFIFHATVKGKAVYFVHVLLVEGMVYYFEQEGPIKDRYVVYNRFRDQVSFTDKLELDPQKVTLAILEVEATSVFPEQPSN